MTELNIKYSYNMFYDEILFGIRPYFSTFRSTGGLWDHFGDISEGVWKLNEALRYCIARQGFVFTQKEENASIAWAASCPLYKTIRYFRLVGCDWDR